jgi:zinc protease
MFSPVSHCLPRLAAALCLWGAAFLPAVVRADIDRAHAPTPGPAPTASFPDYQQATLPNGLKVFVVESRRAPTVTFRLLIKSGDASDGQRPGLSDMTAALLNKGTARRSAEEFAKETDLIGASIEAGSGPDSLSVVGAGLTRNLPQLLDLFADAVLHPAFHEEELAKQQRQAISNLVQQKQQPTVIASKLRGKLLFGSNPYGAYPTEESVSGMKRKDLTEFHGMHFMPANASLAIVGDVHTKDIIPLIEKAFGEWKTDKDYDKPIPPPLPEPPKTLSIHLVDRPGSVQSVILVSRPGIARDNPDAPESGLLNSILGGGFSGRLFQNLRERHGYTYGASSGFTMNRYAGLFTASAQTRNEVTAPAIQEILNEIRRLREEPVPATELGMQREYLIGNYLLSLESPARTAERVQEIDLFKLPADYYKTYVSRVGAISAEQVKALADKYLSPDDATIVVVGEAKDVKEQLEKLGPVIVYDTDLKAKANAN